MNTPDLDEPRYCGNCGAQLLPGKRCPNDCIVLTYVHQSSPGYPGSPIPPTIPSYSPNTPPLPPQLKSNKMYLLVIAALLIIILLGAGVFAGVWIGKNNSPAINGVQLNITSFKIIAL